MSILKSEFHWYGALVIQTVFSLTGTEKEVWTGGTHPMLLPESSYVCIPSFRSVAPRIRFIKVPLLTFFDLMQTQEGLWPYRYS